RRAILLPEEKAKRVLGVARVAAVPATQADAAIDLETRIAVRVEQLDRGWPLPERSVLPGIGVDASGGIEQIIQIHHDRETRDRLQVVANRVLPRRDVYDVGVHSVVHDVGAPGRGPASRGLTVR